MAATPSLWQQIFLCPKASPILPNASFARGSPPCATMGGHPVQIGGSLSGENQCETFICNSSWAHPRAAFPDLVWREGLGRGSLWLAGPRQRTGAFRTNPDATQTARNPVRYTRSTDARCPSSPPCQALTGLSELPNRRVAQRKWRSRQAAGAWHTSGRGWTGGSHTVQTRCSRCPNRGRGPSGPTRCVR